MEKINLNEIRNKIIDLKPIIHCITNPISINQCANSILSLGARPTMAEHPKEVKEITSTASSLLINLGNITDARKKSFYISINTAKKKKIPTTIDLVGVCGTSFRRKLAKKLIGKNPTLIKGNYSEIKSIVDNRYLFPGVDSDETLNENEVIESALKLSRKFGSIVLASGKNDIVTDGNRVCIIKNGVSQLAEVTGTGCMLGAICATILSVQSSFESVIYACALMGVCGEEAESEKGNGTFLIKLIDNISAITEEDLNKKLKIEVKNFE